MCRSEYEDAIKYAASCEFVPLKTIGLIANQWGTPRKVVEQDIKDRRRFGFSLDDCPTLAEVNGRRV